MVLVSDGALALVSVVEDYADSGFGDAGLPVLVDQLLQAASTNLTGIATQNWHSNTSITYMSQ